MDGNSQFSAPQNVDNPIVMPTEIAEIQANNPQFTLKNEPPTPLPKEISDAISGAVKLEGDAKAHSSIAAEPFFYEVRPMQEQPSTNSAGSEERSQQKKEMTCKKVTSILVIYSDGSCDTFTPGPLQPIRQ